MSREREAFSRHKAVGMSEEQEKSQDDCLGLRKAARAVGLRSRIMHGRSRLITVAVGRSACDVGTRSMGPAREQQRNVAA